MSSHSSTHYSQLGILEDGKMQLEMHIFDFCKFDSYIIVHMCTCAMTGLTPKVHNLIIAVVKVELYWILR